ncbi:MAG TPA: hypothetical protein VF169_11305 [Albitalea sp.]|uniref:hypothetical protein n=1 Tax=Piscinibacter sp. TaxID=1903157 RepID=UPI002ED1510E
MRFQAICIASVFSAHLAAGAAELPDCKLSGTMEFKETRRDFLEVSGSVKNGEEVTYGRDEPVLVVDLKVVSVRPVLIPSADVRLKNSWALSQSYRFEKGVPLYVSDVESATGRRLSALSFRDGSVIYLNEDGDFCNKVRTIKPDMQVWQMGTLSKEPDDVRFERTTKDEVGQSGSLRIFYLGTTGGAMQFREAWVQGGQISKSIDRNFDQFAKVIEVAGFKFDVVEVKGDKVKLRYEIPSRQELGPVQRAQIPLQVRRTETRRS